MTEEQEQQTKQHQPNNKQRRQSCLQLIQNAITNPDQLTAMISNYSTSYNAVNVGIVIPVLNYSIIQSSKSSNGGGGDEPYSTPENYYAEEVVEGDGGASSSSVLSMLRGLLTTNDNDNEEQEGSNDDKQESLVASSLLGGMILGQLIGGYLGDILGRRKAMMLVMMLQIGGSLGSAFFISTTNDGGGLTVMEQLAIWRFILGIGAGGVYPLAAVMSAENKQENDDENKNDNNNNNMTTATVIHDNNIEGGNGVLQNEDYNNNSANDSDHECHHEEGGDDSQNVINSFQRIALTFSTQGLGFITVPLLAYPMLELKMNTDIIWRILLGVGAIPGLVVLYLRLCRGGGGGSCFKKRRRKEEREEVIIANDTLDKSDDLNLSNGNDAVGDGLSTMNNSTSPTDNNKERSFELPTVDSHLQAAVSTLFSSEITSSGSDNEMALLDNNNNNVDGNNEDCAYNGADDISPPNDNHSRGLWESIRAEPNLGRKFVGTAGTWFLFDILFYGNTIFEPLVLEAAFGSHSSNANNGYELLQMTVRDSLVISLLSLPGYFVTVLVIGRRTCMCKPLRSSSSTTRCGSASCFPCDQTPVYIQMQGFFIMTILYIIIGLSWTSLSNLPGLLILLYAGTFFFANYGPNTTTFLLPSVTYELEECRSTLNGIAAAAGKFGAFVGASMFEPVADMWGEPFVMISCGIASLFALVLTKLFLGGGRISGQGRDHNQQPNTFSSVPSD